MNELEQFEKYIQQALPYGFILNREKFKYITTRHSYRKIGMVDGIQCLFKLNYEERKWIPEYYSEDTYFLIFYALAHDELEEKGYELQIEDYDKIIKKYEEYKLLKKIVNCMKEKNF